MLTTAWILAIPTACIAWTIAETELFRDLREGMGRWAAVRNFDDSQSWRRWARGKLSYLLKCYYCAAHWVGLFLFVCHPFKLLSDGPFGLVVAFFTQIGIAVLYLSMFHLLRLLIRKNKAEADLAEMSRAARSRAGRQAESRNRGHAPSRRR